MTNPNEFDSPEQRDAYVAGLRVELATCRQRGYADNEAQVLAELARLGVVDQAAAETRPRRSRAAETR